MESAPGLLVSLPLILEEDSVQPVECRCTSQEGEKQSEDWLVGVENKVIQAPPGVEKNEGDENELNAEAGVCADLSQRFVTLSLPVPRLLLQG